MPFDLAWLSLAALVVVIAISCTTQQNPGVIALALAWFLGVYVAEWLGQPIGLSKVIEGFPIDLFLTLTGVTLLFSLAAENGTLEILSRLAVRACRGDPGLLPWAFFFMTAALSTVGAGNIAAAALMAPTAMLTGRRAGIPPFLMVLMVAHGSLAGALSPVAPTGVVALKYLPDHGWTVYGWNLLANVFIAVGAYIGLGGWRLLGSKPLSQAECDPAPAASVTAAEVPDALRGGRAPRTFSWRNGLTLVVIGSLLTSALAFQMTREIGFTAFAGAVLLVVCRAADERRALQGMPWSVTLMVCGVATLTALLEETKGIDLCARLLSRVATPTTAVPLLAGFTGVLSVYSSTSGVIMPAFLPLSKDLVAQMGGGNPLALGLAVIVGGHLVDSSPLSTIGALCLAPVEPPEVRQRVFRPLLAWGMSMTVVGALLCWALFGWMT